MTPLPPELLAEVRAALTAGASPSIALAAAIEHTRWPEAAAVRLAQGVRMGTGLAELVAGAGLGEPGLDLLVRALAVAERTGAGGLAAVEQAVEAAAERDEAERRLRARTAQARGTAAVLAVLPVAAWALLVLMDPSLLRFYTTAPGLLSALAALALGLAGRRWSLRVVARAERAADAEDPLRPRPPRPDLRRAATLAVPALLVVGAGVGLIPGAVAAAVVTAVALRRPAAPEDPAAGGTAETVELLAVALAAGLSLPAATAAVAGLAPPAAVMPLRDAAQRLAGGAAADTAFAGSGLGTLGGVLAAGERWGAPAAPALRRMAADLRAARRAAAEEAAERAQLALVFPTTLLTLPAFTVAAVPPILWAAFAGAGGGGA